MLTRQIMSENAQMMHEKYFEDFKVDKHLSDTNLYIVYRDALTA